MRELGPAFEEGSAPPPGWTVCWGRSLALLASDGWVARAGGTDDSSWKSQLVAGAWQVGLQLQRTMCVIEAKTFGGWEQQCHEHHTSHNACLGQE